MDVWPAIDLRGGRCVRLRQGDYARETVFGDDPAGMARRWLEAGADRLHVVDLDGAREGRWVNREAVAAIVRAAGDAPVQVGGGVRDERTIERLLELGAARVVIGTRAVRDPGWLAAVSRRFPGRLAAGIDAREGRAAAEGWTADSGRPALEAARALDGLPLAAVIYTDIARDGMLEGPNVEAMTAMKRAVSLPVIASGGVAAADDVRRLARAGLDGCIIGRALYEGRLSLAEALAAAGSR